MAGLSGQDRTPQQDVRVRRNSDNLAAVLEFIGAGEVIQISGDGVLTLSLRSDGGLQNDAGSLAILLNPTDPGLVLSADGIATLVQGVLGVDALGVFVNIGDGLENAADFLAVSLASNSGLEFVLGDLRTAMTVSAITTVATTAVFNEVTRYSAAGGTFTITLPPAADHPGGVCEFKESANNTTGVTLDGNAGETIDGSATISIGTTGREHTRVISDGANWMIA